MASSGGLLRFRQRLCWSEAKWHQEFSLCRLEGDILGLIYLPNHAQVAQRFAPTRLKMLVDRVVWHRPL